MLLYHGTTHNFTEIDVFMGKPFKDFGQGFYLSESYDRALDIAQRNRRIEQARQRVVGEETEISVYVYSYEFDLDKTHILNVKRFTSTDREWIKFVIQNRMNRTRQHDYDIVIGPTANDNTRTSIRAVMNAANGTILSDAALDLLIEMLEPNQLPVQYFFGTIKAVGLLKFSGRYELE